METGAHLTGMRVTSLRVLVFASALLLCQAGSGAVQELVPQHDDEVVEVLPAVTRNRPAPATMAAPKADVPALLQQVRADIGVARQTGDTRYWGRAQALLAPWWDKADAPADLAVLQATVQQGRHEFDAARHVLEATLARSPNHAQGWLNLASLERLQGAYEAAKHACDAVARAGAEFYALACQLETRSLKGEQAAAEAGLQRLVQRSHDAGQQAWLMSLLAESLERSGQDAAALSAYRGSLKRDPDLYTAIALGDLLLRTGKPSEAISVVSGLPETDAVLLRRAAAWRALGDARWMEIREVLHERSQELRRRGDDPGLHGRELALVALWLDDDPAGALVLAQRNLELQREPVDWWVALSSARQAGDNGARNALLTRLRASGLRDQRLSGDVPARPRQAQTKP